MEKKRILIICGEPSGDLNASNLAKEILTLDPSAEISAVGGELLQKNGAKIIYNIKSLAVMGFFDVFRKLPLFFALKDLILKKISQEKFNAVILVDFSGFNLRLAKAINNSLPVFYYISPQVWASREKRVNTIKKYIKKMIVIFKFEEEFYKKFGMNVSFVGHPLLDSVKPTIEKGEFLNNFGLEESKKIIALLPGSRKSEIEHILPIMLKSAQMMSRQIKDLQFVLAKTSNVDLSVYLKHLKNVTPLNLKIAEGKAYDCINIADFCLIASGTATLETAIMQKPFFVIYKMNILNYLLYRPQIKIDHISLVNILAGKEIVPEFIQFKAKPKVIASKALQLLSSDIQMNLMKSELEHIKSLLGENGASKRAARIILQ